MEKKIFIEQYQLLKKVALIRENIDEKDRNNEDFMVKRFNKIVYGHDSFDLNKIVETIDNYYNGLYKRVRQKYPYLTDNEFHICYLSSIEANFDDNEISLLTGLSLSTARKIRTNIRKKLNIKTSGNMHEFFVSTL